MTRIASVAKSLINRSVLSSFLSTMFLSAFFYTLISTFLSTVALAAGGAKTEYLVKFFNESHIDGSQLSNKSMQILSSSGGHLEKISEK